MENYLITNTLGYPILSLLLIVPAIGALGCLFIKDGTWLKAWSLVVSVATLVLSLPLFTSFDATTAKYQFAEVGRWFPALNLDYVVGVDGISAPLVLLTTFIIPLCVLCSWRHIWERVKEFMIVMLLMETAMIGVFVSLNTILFYFFWEGMLIPMYLIIAVWGGPRKDYASIKFFLYTFAGSIFLFVAIIALYISTGTFFIPGLMEHHFPFMYQMWIFLAFALSFAVKVPVYPLHTWLPAAHVEAPAAGSVILASILLKMGGYGFLRFCLPVAPQATIACIPWMIGIGLVSIIFGSYLALGQSDMKKLIAYSSVGHMGFVTLGIFLLNDLGIKGAILQMINHGITTGALFICVGLVYERTHSREISANSALGKAMPAFLTFFTIFSLASFGFPGTNGFVSELLVLIAAFTRYPWVGFVSIVGAVLAAAYMLRLLQKMIWDKSGCPGHGGHGHDHEHAHEGLQDLDLREWGTLVFLTFFVLWIGFQPRPLLNMMDKSVAHLVGQVNEGKQVDRLKAEGKQVDRLKTEGCKENRANQVDRLKAEGSNLTALSLQPNSLR